VMLLLVILLVHVASPSVAAETSQFLTPILENLCQVPTPAIWIWNAENTTTNTSLTCNRCAQDLHDATTNRSPLDHCSVDDLHQNYISFVHTNETQAPLAACEQIPRILVGGGKSSLWNVPLPRRPSLLVGSDVTPLFCNSSLVTTFDANSYALTVWNESFGSNCHTYEKGGVYYASLRLPSGINHACDVLTMTTTTTEGAVLSDTTITETYWVYVIIAVAVVAVVCALAYGVRHKAR
jgi:hypothetical protein